MGAHRVVIVGGGLASARAIASYREAGGEGRIALISRDRVLPYHRPPLSKRYLRGEAGAQDTLVEPEEFYESNDVDVVLETTVGHIDTRAREVEVEGGRRYGYERLLIASGATPRRLRVPGSDLEGIYTLRTLADATAIRDAAAAGREALVVGGGFIGMEVASSLRSLGLEVTLIHAESGLFQHVQAPELEHDLVNLFVDNGVELVLAEEVVAFHGRSHVDSIETATGRIVVGDFVVTGIGVEPAVGFLAGSDVEVADGVRVNEHFETGASGVYAVGDAASFYDPLYRRYRRIEHWSNANYQGGRVGAELAGVDAPYDDVSTFFTEFFGLTLKVIGDVDRHNELVVRGSLADRDLVAFYLADGRLVASLLVGQPDETEETLKGLIGQRAIADTERLADPSFELDSVFREPWLPDLAGPLHLYGAP